MPVLLCPDCRKPLQVPDSLTGKPVRCPGCRTVFTPADEELPLVSPEPTSRQEPTREPARPGRARNFEVELSGPDAGSESDPGSGEPHRMSPAHVVLAVLGVVMMGFGGLMILGKFLFAESVGPFRVLLVWIGLALCSAGYLLCNEAWGPWSRRSRRQRSRRTGKPRL